MSDSVVVDADSAVVFYRPAVGEERSNPAKEVPPTALFRAVPWRTFYWYFGQRHYSGTYWSSTECGHVIYESRLELANLLLADFDPAVKHIVAQPFSLRFEVGGQIRRHVPDYLWDTDCGPVVVDVVRAERMTHPRIVLLCAWTKAIVDSLGWTYLVLNEPSATRLSNVRFLAGYRREWLINPHILHEMRSCSEQFDGLSIADAELVSDTFPAQLVRPALMHLLWRHECSVNLGLPLRPSAILEVRQ